MYADPRSKLGEDGHKMYSGYFMRAKTPATCRVGLFLQLTAESANCSVLVVIFQFEENVMTSLILHGSRFANCIIVHVQFSLGNKSPSC